MTADHKSLSSSSWNCGGSDRVCVGMGIVVSFPLGIIVGTERLGMRCVAQPRSAGFAIGIAECDRLRCSSPLPVSQMAEHDEDGAFLASDQK